MTINISIPHEQQELKPRISVIGVGGAGGNAVNNMIRSNLVGCDFIVTNTDAQAMKQSLCERRIQLGIGVTRGLGAGSRPDVGRIAAEEALEEIMEALGGANMVFITAGMGGGTGTGAGPVIARAAREAGILTVGVVTKPFQFEGAQRMRIAEAGIQELQKYVDTLIIIPNQNLFRVANEKTTFADAFKMADDVLYSGVRGVTDLMVMPGLINLDFADIRAIMGEMGKAMMGTGEADGDRRSIDAAEAAISNPLLDDVSMKGARGVLINITGGPDMTLVRGRRGREPHPRGSRSRGEHHLRLDLRRGARGPYPHLRGGDRHRRGRHGAAAAGDQPGERSHAGRVGDGIGGSAAARCRGSRSRYRDDGNLGAGFCRHERAGDRTAATAAGGTAAGDGAGAGSPRPQLPIPAAEPAAAERAMVRNEAFIPPKPVEPQMRAPVVAAPVVSPEPFAAAAMANGARQAAPPVRKARTPSLFERVTGVARNRQASVEPSAPAVTAPTPAPAQPTLPAQPRLGPLDPADRVAVSKAEEDLLEIPAFLRRQAN